MKSTRVQAFLLFFISSALLIAQDPPAAVSKLDLSIFSTKRDPKESWKILSERLKGQNEKPKPAPVEPAEPVKSAFDSRKPGAELVIPEVPTVKSRKDLDKYFAFVRDQRYLPDPTAETFLRRIPWLFPDDGCFMRGALASLQLQKEFTQPSGRAFVFGDLFVDSPNAKKRVTWWYHTAATLKLDDTVYVLDVAIQPKNPLTLKEWVEAQGVSYDTAEISLCGSDTYFPNQLCRDSGPDDEFLKDNIPKYLGEERERQVELYSDRPEQVEKVLGEFPPWAETQN